MVIWWRWQWRRRECKREEEWTWESALAIHWRCMKYGIWNVHVFRLANSVKSIQWMNLTMNFAKDVNVVCCIQTDMNKNTYENPFAIAAMLSYAFSSHFTISISRFFSLCTANTNKYKYASFLLLQWFVWIEIGLGKYQSSCHAISLWFTINFPTQKYNGKPLVTMAFLNVHIFAHLLLIHFWMCRFGEGGERLTFVCRHFSHHHFFCREYLWFFQSNIRRKLTTH